MNIVVASGKGGTGKTTVAVNLARMSDSEIEFLDCDVEAPNAGLFMGTVASDGGSWSPAADGGILVEEIISVPVPEVDATLCDGCAECSRFCAYNAIVALGSTPMVFSELCHGCGGCALVCPRRAIHEAERRIGVVRFARFGLTTLIEGRLDVGQTMAPPLIRAVKARSSGVHPVILDAPPGTSCAAIAALRGADFVLLVAEPTPFGLHDLSLIMRTVRELDLPCGVVVNRAGCGDDRVQAYCRTHAVPLLGEIPDDRRIAEAYARGTMLVDALPAYEPLFRDLAAGIMECSRSAKFKRSGT